MININQIQ